MRTDVLGHWPQWRDKLTVELRLKNVPGPEIGDILTEVAAHIEDTGESPEGAFGDPIQYARVRSATVATPQPRSRRLVVLAGVTIGFFAGGALAAGGAWALGAGDSRWGPLPSWLALVAGLVLLFGILLAGKPNLVTDPRSGSPLPGSAHNPRLVLGSTILSVLTLIAVAGWLFTG